MIYNKREKRTKRFEFRLTESEFQMLEKICEELGDNASRVIRNMICDKFKSLEGEK